jgi:hypothetical protein
VVIIPRLDRQRDPAVAERGESSWPLCDPQCMSNQPPQGRSPRWASVLVVLAVLVVALPVAWRTGHYYWRAAYYYREGVTDGCAEQFLAKAELRGYHWGWSPLPGWVCEDERDGRWERRLRW